MRFCRIVGIAVIFALFSVWTGTGAHAQGNDATLTGTVTDPSGAVIPGATIAVTDEASGVVRTATSDGRGFFSLVGIPVGAYDVKVSAQGFNSLLRKGIAIHIHDQIELKQAVLTVAGSSATVVVTASANELTPTTSGEVSYTITDTQLHDMDIEGRSAIELLGLIPGSGNTGNFNGAYNSSSAGFTQNASAFTVNGNRFDLVAMVSDGANSGDLNTAAATVVTPNVDMISELKVESAAYSSAEPNGPVVVSTETKSGGRDYHGMTGLTARTHYLNANDWQQKANGLPAPNTALFYPDVQFGGPLLPTKSSLHDKLFFFAAMELSQQHVDLVPRSSIVPTLGARTGDFTDTADLAAFQRNSSGWYVGIQPCSSTSWNGWYCSGTTGKLANSAINAAGQALLSAFPKPNADPTAHGGYNLITDFTASEPRNQEILKLDYAINDNTHFSVRFNHENESVPSPYGPWNTWNMVPYPAAQTQKNASNSTIFRLTDNFSSRLTNESTLTWTRFTLKTNITGLNNVSLTANGYPSSYQFLYPNSAGILPNVQFEDGKHPGLGQLYIAGGEVPPYLGAENDYTFNDGITYFAGTHLIRFGAYARVSRYNILTTGNNNAAVGSANWTTTTDNDWADMLIGQIDEYGQSSTNFMADMRANRFDFFAQDTWKAASNLTINYGIRADHIGWWYDAGGRVAIFDPTADVNPGTLSSPNYLGFSGIESHNTNSSVPLSGAPALNISIAPSVGFAYEPKALHNTVIRGGFGTSFYNDPGTNAVNGVLAPPNFQVVQVWTQSWLNSISSSNLGTPWAPPIVWGTADQKDSHAPVTYSWNFAASHQFWGANKVEANYVGNTSRHLIGFGIKNAIPEGSNTGTNGRDGYGTWYDQYFRPYINFGDITVHKHNLDSNYNALQLTVTREKGWLNYWGSYTFGKTLAYNAEDSFNMKRWYGPAPFDRSQILSFSYFIKLPAFGSKLAANNSTPASAFTKKALDDWQISGVFQAMTGGPLTLNPTIGNSEETNTYALNQSVISTWGDSTTPSSDYSTWADGTPDEAAVPKLTCDPRKGLKHGQYFNPSCFAGPTHLSNGVYRIPYIHGPAYINDSLGLFKTFNIKDAKKLEIRGEAFNLFNHSWNWIKPGDSIMYMGFNSTGGSVSSNTSAGIIDNKTGHREVSLAAKYYF